MIDQSSENYKQELTQGFSSREALQISFNSIKINPLLTENAQFNNSSSVIGMYDENYVVYTRRENKYQIDYHDLAVISPRGRLICSHTIKAKYFSIQMPTNTTLLILTTNNIQNSPKSTPLNLTQWNLKTNKFLTVPIKKNFTLQPPQMLIFSESSLVSILGFRLKYGESISNLRKPRTIISIVYYRFPLIQGKNYPVHLFEEECCYLDLSGEEYFEKMNNVSRVSVNKKVQIMQPVYFMSYSIQRGFRKTVLKMSLPQVSKQASFKRLYQLDECIYACIKSQNDQYSYHIWSESPQNFNPKIKFPYQFTQPHHKAQFTNNFIGNSYNYNQNSNQRSQNSEVIPRYYLDVATCQVFGKRDAPNQDWNVCVPMYDGNLEIQSYYDGGFGELLVSQVKLGQLRFETKIIMGFFMCQIMGNFDDDLIDFVVRLTAMDESP